MQLYPMNFKEFLIANGKSSLIDIFQDWSVERAIPELYAEPMKNLLMQYYIVGGMPDVVMEWIETKNFENVEKIQKEILNDYADDFAKHAPLVDIPKIRMIWDSVPVQLAKENNKFVFSHVKTGKRAAELEDALRWLIDAGLLFQVFMVDNASIPLSAYSDATYFKVYMSDIGLLRVKSGLSYRTFTEKSEMFREYKGALVENYVHNELLTLGFTPYFWRSKNTAELDFLFEQNGCIFPVEVKSADNTKAKSYAQFCKNYNPLIGFKLSQKNLALNIIENTKSISLPLYLTWKINTYSSLK